MSGERKRNLKNFFQLLMRYKWHHIAAMKFGISITTTHIFNEDYR